MTAEIADIVEWLDGGNRSCAVLSEKGFAGGRLPSHLFVQFEEVGRFAIAPLKQGNGLGAVSALNFPESPAVILGWPTGGTSLNLDEDNIEQIPALQYRSGRL